jgi:hypothetical protein
MLRILLGGLGMLAALIVLAIVCCAAIQVFSDDLRHNSRGP